MNNVFKNAGAFQPATLRDWDTAAVTSMVSMFDSATAITDGELEEWDVKNVQDMTAMFQGASLYDGILQKWDTGAVTSMAHMFDMSSVPSSSYSGRDIDDWKVGNVQTMNSMFRNVANLNPPKLNWDVGVTTDFSNMFLNAISFNGDISSWQPASGQYLGGLLQGASSFYQDLCDTSFGNDIPAGASVSNMFAGTACEQTLDPDLLAAMRGPFCYVCH